MKLFITVLLIFNALTSSAFSFTKVPLNKMIDRSGFILLGKVIQVKKTDSLLQHQLSGIIHSKDFNYGQSHCGSCTEIASFIISKSLKGKIEQDTISIPFRRNISFLILGLNADQEYILFLNSLPDYNLFTLSEPRFSTKSSHLLEYQSFINKYLQLDSEVEKRNWLMDLCLNPKLSWDGLPNFEHVDSDEFSKEEQNKLSQGLLKMDFHQDHYLGLLELVQGFGKNEDLILKCLARLKEINEKNVHEGFELMLAINEMNPNSAYQDLIDKFSSGFSVRISDQEKLNLIRQFLEVKI